MGFFDSLFLRKPPPDRFAALFIAAARRQGFEGRLDFNADEFRLEHGRNAFFNLHNAYRAYCEAPGAQRDKALHGFVATLCSSGQATPALLSEARPMLRPLIRSRSLIDEIRLHHLRTEGDPSTFEVACLPFGEDCVILLAVDYPETTSTLLNGPCASWQVTLGQALQIAGDNLRDHTSEAFVPVAQGVYQGAWSDGYEASRALLPDVLERVPVRGRPVFMMPTREVLLVTGDHDDAGQLRMVELSLQASRQGRTISPAMFRYQPGGVAHAVPTGSEVSHFVPAGEEAARHLAHLARLYRKEEYDTQKAALDRLNERDGADVFLANYLLYGRQDDPLTSFSITTWTCGVETSLPRADRIALVRPDAGDGMGQTRVVGWQQALAMLGDLMEPEAQYPARYRVKAFPDESRLALLDEIG
ncbi:hypothetical protein [Cupriavidus basilensis]|nr:hypothetical protein [Cupriavidus basilensis]